MTQKEKAVSRRREKKINKIYLITGWREDPKLVHRLRCLEQAEANDIRRRFEASMPDTKKIDEDLRKAQELLAKYGDSSA